MTPAKGHCAPHLEPVWYEFLLWPEKVCAVCGETKPANTDFFGRDKSKEDKLTGACRGCRRERTRQRAARSH